MAVIRVKLIMTTVLIKAAGMCPECGGAQKRDCCERSADDRAQSLVSGWHRFAVNVALNVSLNVALSSV